MRGVVTGLQYRPRRAACFHCTAVDDQMPDVGPVDLLCNRAERGVCGRPTQYPELLERGVLACLYHVLQVS